MSEIPLECENAHKWQQISNSTPLPLVIKTKKGGVSEQNNKTMQVWYCQRCNILKLFLNSGD